MIKLVNYYFSDKVSEFLFWKIYLIGSDSKSILSDLLSVDNQDGIVQLHRNISDDDISLLNFKYLCKCT